MRRRHDCLLFALSASLAACGGSSGSEPTVPAFSGMRIVAGADASDTVLTKPVQALIVELLENGKPRPGVVVRFEGLLVQEADPTSPRDAGPGVFVSAIASNSFGAFVSDTTDQAGRASVLVQLGTRAGDMGVQITAPELGLADTARFTVVPGKAAKVILGVRDTVVRVGGTFSLGASSTDVHGNTRSQDKLTYQALDALGTVDASGAVRAAQAVGRGTIAVRLDGIEDSARYTVVPVAKLTAVYDGPDGVPRLATLGVDGSNLKVIGRVYPPVYPSHSPSEDLFVYQRGSFGQGIELMTGSGTSRVLVNETMLSGTYYPVFSPDGAFVFLSGSSTEPSKTGIYRIAVDGSGLTQISSTDFGYTTPAVSPDGTRIAFSRNAGMFVQSVATGDSVKIGRTGWFPGFSPDGQRIAYIDGGNGSIVIARADGVSSKEIVVGAEPESRVSWMPDGRWLLTRRYDGLVLVNSISNVVVPLPSLRRFREVTVDR
jgi:Tol biopolymer transport system component